MNKQNKMNAIFILLVAVAIGLACSSGSQVEEANKIVDQANKKLEEAKDLYGKTETRNTNLFSANVQTVQQLQYYKANKSEEAKSIVSDYEKVADMLKDVSKQYDDVSRLNVGDKYKDYAKLKSDEFAKRAEAVNIRKGNAQAFAEIDDPKTMLTKFDDNNAKSDRLFKDAEDMGAKAKKIEEENKDLFKQA
jgi:predicted phage tail protein